MRKIILIFLILLPFWLVAQTDSVAPGVYTWKEPAEKSKYGAATVLLEGQTNAMEWMQVSTNLISHSKDKKRNSTRVPGNEEQLCIIQSGELNIRIKDSFYTVGAGSIVLLMPGEVYSFLAGNETPCRYYAIKYRSKLPIDTARGKSSGGSFIKGWNQTIFKPGEKGGRRNFLERPTAMCKRLEIHVTTLKEKLVSHAPHTHNAAEFTIIKEGETQMLIGDQLYKGTEGAIYYAPSNVLHALENKGPGNTTYFAIQFE